MALKALFLLVVVPLVLYHQTQACCLPNHWQLVAKYWAAIAQPKGTQKIQSGTLGEYWDGIGERIRVDLSPGPTTTVLILYKEHVAYTITNNKCRKWTPPVWPNKPVCLPQNGTVSDIYVLGYKPGMIVVDFSFKDSIFSTELGCVPVSASRLYHDKIATQTRFEDYVPTIRNTSVFNVPSICKHAEKVEYEVLPSWQRGLVLESFQ